MSGSAEVVARRVGQALEVAHGVVGEQAEQRLGLGQVAVGGPARRRRAAGGRRSAASRVACAQRLERLERVEGAGRCREGAGLRPALAAHAGARR